ncbi:amylo-alpha-1,6-glucosidase [Pontibacillus marinus]|uniref:Amylo-alpha-16-glucosidase n=1 Tax=Pontibacillus marinus BH030004 = DSM 16465 TaxID=1385511 RepID=A0A0A5I4P2_9BACI|nr:glycogen debranching N-terminal domain-containing protein [Pontibacillus marinus]KGX90797.1 amylo-alpha-16-glucosidase [Pontibacillus marinus BH030004 = DSM 16465]
MSFVPLKHGEVFSVTNELGDMNPNDMGAGIYYRDTRFLRKYNMTINDQSCIFLKKDQSKGIENQFKLSNGDIQSGDAHYEKMDLEINRNQLMYNGIFYDKIQVENGSQKHITCSLNVTFDLGFEDLFEVRGAKREKRGTIHKPEMNHNRLKYQYTGLDEIERILTMDVSADAKTEGNGFSFDMDLKPGDSHTIEVAIQVREGTEDDQKPLNYDQAYAACENELEQWMNDQTKVTTSHPIINKTLERAEKDLYLLATDIGQGSFPVAGIPWFCVPFGRDSMITAIQSLVLNPDLAKSTLLTLAHLQGDIENDWNEEAPGKILHEMRNGEMANLNEIPFKRYYGSIDSTPLYIVLFAETIRWTGDMELMNELLPSVEKALDYVEQYADLDGDGFVEFHKQSDGGLAVQSWKDSNHSMVHKEGTHSESPMAVVEVQGYVYDAKSKMAELYKYIGEEHKAQKLIEEAQQLKKQFNEAFWMEHEDFYALALDKNKKQVQTITSDPGHALWSTIIEESKVQDVARVLLSDKLYSGWGIRTMSQEEKVYNPIAYHNGTVWPHDNSLILLGLAKHSLKDQVNQLVQSLFESANQFEDARLPELFCGHSREEEETIVPFPVACSPQAWAAGTPFACVQALLGMEVNAFTKSISINPTLPEDMDWIEVNDLTVGSGKLNVVVKKVQDHVVATVEQNTSEFTIIQ